MNSKFHQSNSLSCEQIHPRILCVELNDDDDDDGNGDDDIQPSVSCLNQRTLGGGKARILHAKLALVVNIV